MSCYVFTNLVVTAGMLQPGMGTVGIVGWQVFNQSLNVAFNTANSNKSSPMSTSVLVKSYLSAVGASCSVALGLNAVVPRLNVTPSTRAILGRLIPFAAVATAAGLNTYLMRRDEIVKASRSETFPRWANLNLLLSVLYTRPPLAECSLRLPLWSSPQ
jgi:hypothetical protein